MIAFALAAASAVFDDPALDSALDRAPARVRTFVMRAVSCNHWAGEEPYDAARRREIEHALRADRCDRIDSDAMVLKRRHAADRETLKVIAAVTAVAG